MVVSIGRRPKSSKTAQKAHKNILICPLAIFVKEAYNKIKKDFSRKEQNYDS